MRRTKQVIALLFLLVLASPYLISNCEALTPKENILYKLNFLRETANNSKQQTFYIGGISYSLYFLYDFLGYRKGSTIFFSVKQSTFEVYHFKTVINDDYTLSEIVSLQNIEDVYRIEVDIYTLDRLYLKVEDSPYDYSGILQLMYDIYMSGGVKTCYPSTFKIEYIIQAFTISCFIVVVISVVEHKRGNKNCRNKNV